MEHPQPGSGILHIAGLIVSPTRGFLFGMATQTRGFTLFRTLAMLCRPYWAQGATASAHTKSPSLTPHTSHLTPNT